jgi:hypothetical protein
MRLWLLIDDRFCWIVLFDKGTGKVVETREYMNSPLVKEVLENN